VRWVTQCGVVYRQLEVEHCESEREIDERTQQLNNIRLHADVSCSSCLGSCSCSISCCSYSSCHSHSSIMCSCFHCFKRGLFIVNCLYPAGAPPCCKIKLDLNGWLDSL